MKLLRIQSKLPLAAFDAESSFCPFITVIALLDLSKSSLQIGSPERVWELRGRDVFGQGFGAVGIELHVGHDIGTHIQVRRRVRRFEFDPQDAIR